MATPEIIGLLCAGCTNYHAVHGGHGGELTRAEIAGLLSGLDPMAMDLALAMYAGDINAERRLIALMRTWAIGIALSEQWKIVKGRPTVSNMAAFAVIETVRPNICQKCHGTGFISARQCRCCSGLGRKTSSGRTIAEAIGVDHVNFVRTWKARYELCINKLSSINGDIGNTLYRSDKVFSC